MGTLETAHFGRTNNLSNLLAPMASRYKSLMSMPDNQTEQHLKTLNQHLDHDYCQYNKDTSALEDPTYENKNWSDLRGALGFSPTADIIFEIKRSSQYQIEA